LSYDGTLSAALSTFCLAGRAAWSNAAIRDMPELINRAKMKGHIVGVFPIHDSWQDVGNPDDLDRAGRHYKTADDAVR
jgi:hypothetical protein